jgi:hypothetical protein
MVIESSSLKGAIDTLSPRLDESFKITQDDQISFVELGGGSAHVPDRKACTLQE